jgi:hypothetical protein
VGDVVAAVIGMANGIADGIANAIANGIVAVAAISITSARAIHYIDFFAG